jgi:membrane protease YdiL (CAAX protease family)
MYLKKTLIIIGAFLCFLLIWRYHIPRKWIMSDTLLSSLKILADYLFGAIPVFVSLLWIHKRNFIVVSGLQLKGFLSGFLFALLFTFPMFIGYAVKGTLNTSFTVNDFFVTVLIAGVGEELFFRGFLFGQLFRFCRWGFVPAVLINGLIFGLLHLYQSTDIYSALSVFGVTSLGALLFCWVYVEWNNNLWIVIWLHALMNCSWIVFSISHDAAGNLYANIFRGITILLVIIGAIGYKRYYKLKYNVRLSTLWINKGVEY